MHRTLVLAAVLLSGCSSLQSPGSPNAFSDRNAARNLDVMKQCASIIAKVPFALTDDERNWH